MALFTDQFSMGTFYFKGCLLIMIKFFWQPIFGSVTTLTGNDCFSLDHHLFKLPIMRILMTILTISGKGNYDHFAIYFRSVAGSTTDPGMTGFQRERSLRMIKFDLCPTLDRMAAVTIAGLKIFGGRSLMWILMAIVALLGWKMKSDIFGR